MLYFAFYRPDGRVFQYGDYLDEDDFAMQIEVAEELGCAVVRIEAIPDLEHQPRTWINPGLAGDAVLTLDQLKRPVFPATLSKTLIDADDVDEAVLSGVPAGCEITIDGQTYTIDDGEIRISSPMAAIYHLSAAQWPYLDWEASVEAVA